jgi:histidyl-tRNA synthetase
MANPVNPPRGMRDFLPMEKRKRDSVLDLIRGTYAAHGFQEIETPAMEDLARLTSGQGGDNEKLAYRVMKRGAELDDAVANGGELADLGLRFDLTVPLTRYYATNRAQLPNVFKAIQTGPVWRAERPQKGRYRQFVQCDIDIIGDATSLAEVELLTASINVLNVLGLTDAVIRVNHRALLVKLLNELGVAEADHGSAMITIDKLDKIEVTGVVAELSERLGSAVGEAFAAWFTGMDATQVPAELAHIFDLVEPGRLRYDPTLVRGMGYYTGPIFEIDHPGSGSSIGGGGRYDGMVGRWLGTDVPAVGISLGFERVVDLVADEEIEDTEPAIVLVLEDDSVETTRNAFAMQREFWAKGAIVRLEHKPKRLNLLLDSMSTNGYDAFAIIKSSTTSLEDVEVRAIGQSVE